eukprot:11322.XXX_466704_466862_1 [CDS] Oithona nana genome sequencing.
MFASDIPKDNKCIVICDFSSSRQVLVLAINIKAHHWFWSLGFNSFEVVSGFR